MPLNLRSNSCAFRRGDLIVCCLQVLGVGAAILSFLSVPAAAQVDRTSLEKVFRQVPTLATQLRLSGFRTPQDRMEAFFTEANAADVTQPAIKVTIIPFATEQDALQRLDVPEVQVGPSRIESYRGRRLQIWMSADDTLVSNSYYQVKRFVVSVSELRATLKDAWRAALAAVVDELAAIQ